MGKHKGKSPGQLETDLFEAQQTSSIDPMIDRLQQQYDELLNHSEREHQPQVDLDELLFHLDGPDELLHLPPPNDQTTSLQADSHQQSEQTTTEDTARKAPDTSGATEKAVTSSQSDEVDGFFASFSEVSNSSDPSGPTTPPFTADDDESLPVSRSRERRQAGLNSVIAQPQSDTDWGEYSFDDAPLPPQESNDTMAETYTDPPVRNRGNGLIIAATALSLIAAISGTIYWTTSSPTSALPGDPTARAAPKEKLLADARASIAQQDIADTATTVPAASTEAAIAPATTLSTAEQLQQAQTQLAEEKQRLALAKSASAQQLTEEKARAEAAAQQLATQNARAEAERQRLAAEKAAAEKARAEAAAQQLAAQNARAEAERQRLTAEKAAAEKARTEAAAQQLAAQNARAEANRQRLATRKVAAGKTAANPTARQQVTVSAPLYNTGTVQKTARASKALRHATQQQQIMINDDVFATEELNQTTTPVTTHSAIIATASDATSPVKANTATISKQQSTTDRPHASTGWAIILSSTSSAKSARQYMARMKALGVETEATSDTDHGRVYHRIRMTGFSTRQQAEQQLQRITRKLGIQGAKIEKM